MLTLRGVTKAFGERIVLNGLDLSVDAGASVAILGANGSGKTTTLRCIVGLAKVTGGSIAVEGIDVTGNAVDARRHLSYLPQKSAFPATLTVRESLTAVARLRGETQGAVDRELALCGLEPLADRSVAHLSGGERQRLAMAVAFLPAVGLYLFDEPSAHLDAMATQTFFRRARQLVCEGRTLVFTTHIPADVRHLATRVVLLRNGRIETDGCGEFELRRYERMLEKDLWGDMNAPMAVGERR